MASDNTAAGTTLAFEAAYELIGEIAGKPEGYRKDYNDKCLFLAKSAALATGGGLHTYVGGYNWFTGSNANANTRSVRGFRRGNRAYISYLSPFTMAGYNSPSYSFTYIGFGTCVQVDTDGELVD